MQAKAEWPCTNFVGDSRGTFQQWEPLPRCENCNWTRGTHGQAWLIRTNGFHRSYVLAEATGHPNWMVSLARYCDEHSGDIHWRAEDHPRVDIQLSNT
jgi:hypothetical protein